MLLSHKIKLGGRQFRANAFKDDISFSVKPIKHMHVVLILMYCTMAVVHTSHLYSIKERGQCAEGFAVKYNL